MSIFDVADHSQMFSDPSEGWKFHRVWLFSATSPFIFTADENASQTLMWVNLISKTHTDEPVSRSQTDHVAGITWTGDLLILFTFIFTVVCIIVSKNPVLFATIYYIYIYTCRPWSCVLNLSQLAIFRGRMIEDGCAQGKRCRHKKCQKYKIQNTKILNTKIQNQSKFIKIQNYKDEKGWLKMAVHRAQGVTTRKAEMSELSIAVLKP